MALGAQQLLYPLVHLVIAFQLMDPAEKWQITHTHTILESHGIPLYIHLRTHKDREWSEQTKSY